MSNKTMYHSELAKRAPVELTIRSGVERSKYRGSPDYVVVFDHEDEQERRLNLENESIGDELEQWKGCRVLVRAGDRDEKAWVEVEEVRGSGRREERRDSRRDDRRERETDRGSSRREERREDDRRESRREEAPRREREPEHESKRLTAEEKRELEIKELRRAYVYGTKCANLMIALMPIARTLCEEAASLEIDTLVGDGPLMQSEYFRTTLHTLFIEVKSRTNIDALPFEFPDMKPGKAKTAPVKQKQEPAEPSQPRNQEAPAPKGRTYQLDPTKEMKRSEAHATEAPDPESDEIPDIGDDDIPF